MRMRLATLLLLVSPFVLPVAAAYVQWATVGLPACRPVPRLLPTRRRRHGFPALAPCHPLRQLPVHHPADPQRPANPHGPPPAVLERPLHPRHGVAPAHAGRGAPGPGLDRQGRLPLPLALDRPARLPAHGRHGPALALPQRAVLGGATASSSWPCCSAPGQWRRLVPTSWQVVPDAWAVFVHYATFHLPPEPDGFYRYNALQQLAYFARGLRPGPAGDPDRARRCRRR